MHHREIKAADPKEYRETAELYYKIGLDVEDKQKKQERFERAISIVNKIKNLGPYDYRLLARIQNAMGVACDDDKSKLTWYENAAKTLTLVNTFTVEDWRVLALYQNNAAFVCDKKQESKYFKKAINSLKHIPHEDREAKDWLRLSQCQNYLGLSYDDKNKGLKRYKEAIDSFGHLQDPSPNKRRTLVIFMRNAAIACQNKEEKLEWFIKDMDTLKNISNLMQDDMRELGDLQIAAGVICKKLKRWPEAQHYFFAAIDSYSQFPSQIYSSIAESYKKLENMQFDPLAQAFYSLAYQILTNQPIDKLVKKFYQLYFAIMKIPQPNDLLRGLLSLMRLIEANFLFCNFPNATVTQWLLDENKHEQFKKSLHEAESLYSPLSLPTMLDNAPNASLALAALIQNQQREIQILQAEVVRLSGLFQSQAVVSQSQFTVFASPVITARQQSNQLGFEKEEPKQRGNPWQSN